MSVRNVKLFVGFLLFFGATSCFSHLEMEPEYGMSKIITPDGQPLYFRRKIHGLVYDRLSMTFSPDHCREPDKKVDILYRGNVGNIALFYRFEGETLHIHTPTLTDGPSRLTENLKVEHHHINNGRYMYLEENHAKEGLEIVEVKIDTALTCDPAEQKEPSKRLIGKRM